MTQLLTKKNFKNDFKKFFVEITQKNDLKLHKNVKTENDPWCVLTPISQHLLGQNSKVRLILKSSEQGDFKTDLTF